MGVEIEKKYRIEHERKESIRERLRAMGAVLRGEDFEENVIYAGGELDPRRRILRLRRVGDTATLAYKERFSSASSIKHQREDETPVGDPVALANILDALGFKPALVYEKRRETWDASGALVTLDELPFGFYLEIEGNEGAITRIEELLGLSETDVEAATYPELASQRGSKRGSMVEARFFEGGEGQTRSR
jgi:adenylate cyclase class 2